MSEALLDAKGVHAWYGSSHVLHGVDLRIDAGETVGSSGATAWERPRSFARSSGT